MFSCLSEKVQSQRGFTLVEIIIAFTILMVGVGSAVPLFLMNSRVSATNRAKTIATNLANRELERVRNMNYNDVGTVGGNPSGTLDPDYNVTISNIDFNVKTRVWWVDDPDDGLSLGGSHDDGDNHDENGDNHDENGDNHDENGDNHDKNGDHHDGDGDNHDENGDHHDEDGDNHDENGDNSDDEIPFDYKKVTVTVSWSGVWSSPPVKVSTLVVPEGEETLYNRGNIRVKVEKADGTPVASARIQVQGPYGSSSNWTGTDGEVLFGALRPSQSENDYTVTASKSGYVDESGNSTPSKSATVRVGQTTVVVFKMDIPGRLVVHLVDKSTGQPITQQSTLTLTYPDSSQKKYNSSDGNYNISGLFPATYQIVADAASYDPSDSQEVLVDPNKTTEITIELSPTEVGNLHLEVFDANTREQLGPAQVKLTERASGEVTNENTNSNGILEIRLEPGRYDIEVSKEDYQTWTDQFTLSQAGNINLNAYLSPVPPVGSIVVRTERLRGSPRNRVWVRVVGSGYDQSQRTGSYQPGEALFDNLNPGDYTVYRRIARFWMFPRRVTVKAGEQSRVVYRY